MRTRDLDREVAALGDLARDELVALWQRNHGCLPPSGVRRELMIRSAAWHLQAKRLGGHDAECRRLLKAAIQSARAALERGSGRSTKLGSPAKVNLQAVEGEARRSARADALSGGGSLPAAGDRSALAGNNLDAVATPAPIASRGPGNEALPARKQRRSVGPGTRLMRDWNGKTHVVDVIDAGYVFEGKLYTSLTSIAERITGAHWSGPRFFGL